MNQAGPSGSPRKATTAHDLSRVRKLAHCRVQQLPRERKSKGQQRKGHTTSTWMRPRDLGFQTLRSNPDDYQPRIPTRGRQRAAGVGRMAPVTSRVGKQGNGGRPLSLFVSFPLHQEQGPIRANPLLTPRPSRFVSYEKCGMRQPSHSEQKECVEGQHENGGHPEEPPSKQT